MPGAQQEYYDRSQSKAAYKAAPVSARLIARRRASRRLGGDRAHQIMAAQPLVRLSDIYQEVFERLTNERVTANRGTVYAAAEGFQTAKESGLPILLVLYQGEGDDKDEWDSRTKTLVKDVFHNPRLAPVLDSYIKIFVPRRQLAALSNLTKLPVYETPGQTTPMLITTDFLGNQTGTLYGSITADQLIKQLAPAVYTAKVAQARKLGDEGEYSTALKILQDVKAAPTSSKTHRRTLEAIDQVKFLLAKHRAEEGREQSAFGLLTTLSQSAIDKDVRLRAAEYLRKLRSGVRRP